MSSRSGQGYVYRPTYRCPKTGKRKRSKTWRIGYSIAGKKHTESSGSARKADADALLNRRLAERGRGVTAREAEAVTFQDLKRLIEADYTKNARRSTRRLDSSLKHLSAAFSGWAAVRISETAIDHYSADRLKEGAAPATINRELAALRRMFSLAAEKKKLRADDVPAFKTAMLEERNVRKGFVDPAGFEKLQAELPAYLKALATVAYISGWRRGELMSRKWRHVDFDGGWLRLEPGESKNGEGRQFPLIGPLREALEVQRERVRVIERETDAIVPHVFPYLSGQRAGAPLGDFRKAWQKATKAAELEGFLFHDLRRSAVRNFVRSGIPESLAMKYSGHQTASVFRRYAITDESMLREGGDKLESMLSGGEREAGSAAPIAGQVK